MPRLCPDCGYIIRKKRRYCRHCGRNVSGIHSPEFEREMRDLAGLLLFLILVWALMLAVAYPISLVVTMVLDMISSFSIC